MVVDKQSTQEKAQDWLSSVTNEDEEVKNYVLQQIMETEGGFTMLKPDSLGESYTL